MKFKALGDKHYQMNPINDNWTNHLFMYQFYGLNIYNNMVIKNVKLSIDGLQGARNPIGALKVIDRGMFTLLQSAPSVWIGPNFPLTKNPYTPNLTNKRASISGVAGAEYVFNYDSLNFSSLDDDLEREIGYNAFGSTNGPNDNVGGHAYFVIDKWFRLGLQFPDHEVIDDVDTGIVTINIDDRLIADGFKTYGDKIPTLSLTIDYEV
jgi:hypothetical protein